MTSHPASDSGLLWLMGPGRRLATPVQRVAFFLALLLFAVTLVAGLVHVVALWQRLPGPSMDSLPMARRHAAAGDWARAAAEYRAAYFVNWLNRGNISALASALTRAGDRQQLKEVLQHAAQISGDPDVHMRLAVLLLQSGESEAAVATVDRFVALYPASAQAHLSRGKLFSQLQQYEPALVSLDRALQLDPTLVEAWFGLARSRLARRELDESLHAFERLLALDPQMAVAHNGIGLIHLERGEVVSARQSFQAALAIDPSFVAAQQNLERLGAAAGASP